MKELQQILKRIDSLKPNEKAVLATIVDVQGSSYRLPGAKMLILENGETCGMVSGGCLEADVLERAKNVMETGEPQLFTYDTTNTEDSVFSFNMGCRGIIRILLEPAQDNDLTDFLSGSFYGNGGVICTKIAEENFGERLYFDGESFSAECSEDIQNAARVVFMEKRSRIFPYGLDEYFYDYIPKPVRLIIFGAGADAAPLSEIAKDIGWWVSVVDHRPALANSERFPGADQILGLHPEELGKNFDVEKDSIAVLMTHNYDHDKEILKFLLEKDPKYIGMLGPKARTEKILQELKERGAEIPEENEKKLYAPVGLDIGAQQPEMIAVSIIAEIQAILGGRGGGHLRNREGSIYDRK